MLSVAGGLLGVVVVWSIPYGITLTVSLVFSSMGLRGELRKQTKLMQEREQQLSAIRKSVERNADELKDVSQGLMILNKQFREHG